MSNFLWRCHGLLRQASRKSMVLSRRTYACGIASHHQRPPLLAHALGCSLTPNNNNKSRFFSTNDDTDDKPLSQMSNEELADTSTIPGWHLIHTPPQRENIPRGALVGTVVSDKMQKTINVEVDRFRIVPKIRKRMRYTRKFMAHDENEVANAGDLVMIVPSQRISKKKHFMLREIIRAKGQL